MYRKSDGLANCIGNLTAAILYAISLDSNEVAETIGSLTGAISPAPAALRGSPPCWAAAPRGAPRASRGGSSYTRGSRRGVTVCRHSLPVRQFIITIIDLVWFYTFKFLPPVSSLNSVKSDVVLNYLLLQTLKLDLTLGESKYSNFSDCPDNVLVNGSIY